MKIFLILVLLLLTHNTQAIQSLYIDISGQETLSTTGDNISWSILNTELAVKGNGISSLSWTSYDNTQVREIYLLGNFSVKTKQRIYLEELFNITNETLDTSTEEYTTP